MTAPLEEPDPPYAGLVTRTIALAIDSAIVSAVFAVSAVILGLAIRVVTPGENSIGLATVLEAVGAWWICMGAYLVGYWRLAGQTPGMRVMRLELTTMHGERLNARRGIVRLAGMVLAALPLLLGYALILVDDRRQGLHDKLARTFVLYADDDDRSLRLRRVERREPVTGPTSSRPASPRAGARGA
jgi:uncharacterized RDD family membrane protein YckC